MGRGRKLPTLTTNDFVRVLRADGWYPVEGTKHLAFKHATKTGKVNVSAKWSDIRAGDMIFRSVLEQAELSRREFERLYWESR